MTVEDPFFVVKNEVVEAVNKTKDLYQRWCELKDLNLISKEEIEWTTNELKNSFRSIEWDLEDLEETISIVEKNPKKFKIDCTEISTRKAFIEKTKEEVQSMKDKMFETREKKMRQGLLGTGYAKYTRLENEIESPTQSNFIEEQQKAQQLIVDSQEEQIERVGATVGTLKSMSSQIRNELEEQSVMLDELGYEMEVTESKMDATVSKIAKALHMTSDRRQWTAIGVLLLIIFIVILLFFIL
ncbi:syntaxin-6-like [Argiope bruennichi]|uniref:Syntaxin-6 like protein n=1 Tax=Argiope bruennichi TaxID=94029 RepID=A0A8T0FDZ0_ARGBR|nr:syntaxin-6-like [Argiope bruennichi]KAF8787510.1 Syntaxin-6 like protein [Argiope bruennichi]